MNYEIETGVPLPDAASQRFPFNRMRTGDSFRVPAADVKSRRQLNYATQYAGRKYGHKYAIRCDGDGFRVWRVD